MSPDALCDWLRFEGTPSNVCRERLRTLCRGIEDRVSSAESPSVLPTVQMTGVSPSYSEFNADGQHLGGLSVSDPLPRLILSPVHKRRYGFAMLR